MSATILPGAGLAKAPPARFEKSAVGENVLAESALQLVLIFGAARSGTTWLAKLFDSSPDVLYIHEPFLKGAGLTYHAVVKAMSRGDLDAVPDRDTICSELIAQRRTYVRPPFFHKRYASSPLSFGPLSLTAFSWYLGKLTGLHRLPAGQVDGPIRLVIKEGLSRVSLSLASRLGAQAVVLFRHPCAVVSSRLRGERCGAMEKLDRRNLLDANESVCRALGFSPDVVLTMQDDEALALDWLLTYLPVCDLADDCPAEVRWLTYETLVEQSEQSLSQLFTACRLPLTRQTRDFLAHSSQANRTGLRALLGRPARYFGVERRVEEPAYHWRKELPPDSIQRILRVAAHFPLARYWPEA